MKSRYLFRAKRKDNGGWIEGCLAQYPSGRCRIFQTSSNGEGAAIKGMFEVDPETVEPVAAKLEKDKGHYKCPNCGVYFAYAYKEDEQWEGTTPYCGNCGQRLDWEKNK